MLSGDQLYRMDLEAFVTWHRDNKADLTVAVSAVPRDQASSFGLMKIDDSGRIVDFVEKPQDPAVLEDLVVPRKTLERLGFPPDDGFCLASMGIDVDYGDTLMHISGNILRDNVSEQVKPFKQIQMIAPPARSE